MFRRYILFFLLVVLTGMGVQPRGRANPGKNDKYGIYVESAWVDSLMAHMTVEEKIGQLFTVSAFSSKERFNMEELRSLVTKHHVGGVIFFKGTPYRQAEMTNELQKLSNIPLLISIDAEWGLAMRLDSTVNFGYQMPLGAIQDDSMAYRMGLELARQCRRLGIHVNFAPVVDVNNNPLNPVINLRSFGEDKRAVARKAIMYMRGLQDGKVLAVAKHFPGHGNTDVDSHLDLPILKHSQKSMDTLELYPFRQIFAQGVGGVMTAHLHIPAYDTTANVASSMSPLVSSILLRHKMHFGGLAFSDALNMRGVSKFFKPGELEFRTLIAGNDVLLCSEDVPKAAAYIKNALDSGCMDMEYLDTRVRRILMAKKWAGLDTCRYIDMNNLTADLNRPEAIVLKKEIARKSITVVRNDQKLIPVGNLQKVRVANVAFGTQVRLPFQKMLENYNRHDFFLLPMTAPDSEYSKLLDTLKGYDFVILSLHRLSNKNTGTYGMSRKTIDFINELNTRKNIALVTFGTPYAFDRFPKVHTLICAYQDDAAFQEAAAQTIYGGNQTQARLPVSASAEIHRGLGTNTPAPDRLQYTLPEDAGMSSTELARIDKVVAKAINAGAMPGCQILVARKGKVVYQKSFGYHVYSKVDPVINSDIYDLASVTKVAATTITAMKLFEMDSIKLFHTLGEYLPELHGTDKAGLQIKEVMSHQAGLKEWIPFYKYTLDRHLCPDEKIYCVDPNELYTLRVAERMYMSRLYRDTVYSIIDNSKLESRGRFRYSDLGFLYMQRILERQTGQTLDRLADSLFYRPLGLATMTFRPRQRFPLDRIVPTEQDNYFRYQLVHGDVHDPAAAMLGGVAGHAGLFSNANDLAILMQMMLNGGTYGGRKYLDSSTIRLFTSKQYDGNRRGLGWDKPALDPSHGSPASKYASASSFGHTGFTGTCVWVDPEQDLIYIFLSNRVNPSAETNKLAQMNVRTDIHDIIYESIFRYKR